MLGSLLFGTEMGAVLIPLRRAEVKNFSTLRSAYELLFLEKAAFAKRGRGFGEMPLILGDENANICMIFQHSATAQHGRSLFQLCLKMLNGFTVKKRELAINSTVSKWLLRFEMEKCSKPTNQTNK